MYHVFGFANFISHHKVLGLGVHGIYLNSSILDEEALVKTYPLHVKGQLVNFYLSRLPRG